MQSLKSHFSLIDPGRLKETLAQRGFGLTRQAQRSLPAGKSLWMGVFGQ
jgi:hypothetical protein